MAQEDSTYRGWNGIGCFTCHRSARFVLNSDWGTRRKMEFLDFFTRPRLRVLWTLRPPATSGSKHLERNFHREKSRKKKDKKEILGFLAPASSSALIKPTLLFGRGKLIQKLREKGIYEERFSRQAARIGGKLIQLMHSAMVPEQLLNINPDRGSNEGLPYFCSPPLGGEQGKKKLINQLSPFSYLYPGYGAASVSMAASPGLLLLGKRTSSTPGSCPDLMGLLMP
uniref:Uncharacterized protein n=1 Tax=Tanacetum cinerariifolium TaxID=118510 RepID=A0A6L2KQU6_TANCI|nr:hypothetical protein [Tanacetum cinerariifolium]